MASNTPVLVSVPEDVLLEAVAALGVAESLRLRVNLELTASELEDDDVFAPAAAALRKAAFPGLDDLDDDEYDAHPAVGGVWQREAELQERVIFPFEEAVEEIENRLDPIVDGFAGIRGTMVQIRDDLGQAANKVAAVNEMAARVEGRDAS